MRRSTKQTAVDELAFQIHHALDVNPPEREYRFHPTRRWRFDLALIGRKVAVEVDGGIYVQGRHSRGAGYEEDLRKVGAALELGWIVVRTTPRLVKSGEALRFVEAAVKLREKR